MKGLIPFEEMEELKQEVKWLNCMYQDLMNNVIYLTNLNKKY